MICCKVKQGSIFYYDAFQLRSRKLSYLLTEINGISHIQFIME